MSDLNRNSLKVQHDSAKREFFIEIPGCKERAFLSYEPLGGRVVDLQHTVVPETFRGRGMGKLLAQAALQEMAAENMQMRLTCWYLKKFVEENPSEEYSNRIIP
uniref:Protein NATD1 n=1 Tax=Ciona savignyi TaxID=51511 RepID=H2YIA0_CIOSA